MAGLKPSSVSTARGSALPGGDRIELLLDPASFVETDRLAEPAMDLGDIDGTSLGA